MNPNLTIALKILSMTAAGSIISAMAIALVWDYSSYLQDGQTIFDSSNRVELAAVIGFCIGLFVGGARVFLFRY